jgi:hypothetical protein
MSNSLGRRLCLQAGVILASAWLVNTGNSQQSGGGISSLGITDDGRARFTWEANSEPDLAGYRLYVGTMPGLYSGYVDVGKVTAYELTDLLRGMRYYFALTAYNAMGLESGFTPELTWQVPLVASGGVLSDDGAPVTPSPLPEADVTDNFVDPENSPPTISSITPQLIAKNRPSEPIPFTIGDPESPASALQVIAESWNPIVLPPDALILEGSDDQRTLTIDPANGQSGTSMVTLAVTDGTAITSMSFEVTVENGDVVTHVLAPLE